MEITDRISDTNPTQGVLYVATGRRYILSAIHSARSVRRHNPDLPIHLFADWQAQGFDFETNPAPFTSVGSINAGHYRSKVDYSVETPFEHTLYLDTDTRVLTDITPLFDLLDRFDIAVAHAPNRLTRLMNWRVPVPVSFPQFNCGVMVYKNSEKVMKFLRDWIEAFHQAGFRSDQITFRELVWLSDLRVATLAPEYNLRHLKYFLVWGAREARPKILHLALFHQHPLWVLRRWVKALVRR